MKYPRFTITTFLSMFVLSGITVIADKYAELSFPPMLKPVVSQSTGWHPVTGDTFVQTFKTPTEKLVSLGIFPIDDETGFSGGIRVAVYKTKAGEPVGKPLFSTLINNRQWREFEGKELRLPLLLHGLEKGGEYALVIKPELIEQMKLFNRRFTPVESLQIQDWIFDFGNEKSPAVPGTTAVTDHVWKSGRKFGWNRACRGNTRHTYNPLIIADSIMCDGVEMPDGAKNRRRFTVSLPDGKYKITMLLGTPWEYGGGRPLGNMTVTSGKHILVDKLHLPPKTYVLREAEVTAVNNKIPLTFISDGAYGGWGIMALRITSCGKEPGVQSCLAMKGFTRSKFAGTLKINGKIKAKTALNFFLYDFAPSVATSFGDTVIQAGRMLTGAKIRIYSNGTAAFSYSGVGVNELEYPEESKMRYINDAIKINNVGMSGRYVIHALRNRGKNSELVYDLASLRPDLGPLTLVYHGGAIHEPHGLTVSVSDDGKNFNTISHNCFGQFIVFQKRFLRFQFDYGQATPNYVNIGDFTVRSLYPVKIPGLQQTFNNTVGSPNPVSVASGARPALIWKEVEEKERIPISGPMALKRYFPLGVALSFENISRYSKSLNLTKQQVLTKVWDDFKAHNINTVYINNCALSEMETLLDLSEARGIRLLPMLGDIMIRYHSAHRGKGYYQFDRFVRNAVKVAARIRSRKGLLAYIVEEECPWPEEMRKYSDVVRKYDPSHAVLNLQMINGNKKTVSANPFLPVTLTDIYPRMWYHLNSKWYEANLASEVAVAKTINANFWVMPQTQCADRPRIPGPGDIRLQAWTAVAYGAKGVIYWTYLPALRRRSRYTGTPQLNALATLFKTLKPLCPLLLDTRPDLFPFAFAVDSRKTMVRCLVDRLSGTEYAVVANRSTDRSEKVDIAVSNPVTAVYDLQTFEPYQLVENTSFTKQFSVNLGPGDGRIVVLGDRETLQNCIKRYNLVKHSPESCHNRAPEWETAIREFCDKQLTDSGNNALVKSDNPDVEIGALNMKENTSLFFKIKNNGSAGDIDFSIKRMSQAFPVYNFSDLREYEPEKAKKNKDYDTYRVYFGKGEELLFMRPVEKYGFFTLLDTYF